MRPITNGKTPKASNGKAASKTPGTATKRAHTRRGAKFGEVNGVKKTMVKAKVSVVKAKQRLRGADKEEVKDLLEQSLTAATVVTPKKSEPKESLQQKLKKSVSNLELEFKKRTTRSSARGGQTAEPPKPEAVDEPDLGKKNGTDVEMAEEATESPQKSGPGFLKRAVSKLWKIPMEGINGVPYNDIGSAPSSPTPAPKSPSNGVSDNHERQNGNSSVDSGTSNKSCVIS